MLEFSYEIDSFCYIFSLVFGVPLIAKLYKNYIRLNIQIILTGFTNASLINDDDIYNIILSYI